MGDLLTDSILFTCFWVCSWFYYIGKLLKAPVGRSADLQLLDLTRSSNVDLLDEVVNDREGKDHSYEEGHGEHYREDGPRNIQAGNN